MDRADIHPTGDQRHAKRGMQRFRRFVLGPVPYLLPSIVLLLLVTGYPLVVTVLNSLKYYNLSVAPKPLRFVALANFRQAFADPTFVHAIWITLEFALIACALEMVLGVAVALVLNLPLQGTGIVRSVLIMPTAIAPIVAGLMFRYLYDPSGGFITYLLREVGVPVPSQGILGSSHTALLGLVATDVWQWTPFVALIVLAAIQGVPGELLEAAQLDGASSWQSFWRVTIPMIRRPLAVVGLLRLMYDFNIFDIVFAETRGGPGVSTHTLGLDVFFQGLSYYNIGGASAKTILIALFANVLVLVYVLLFMRGASSDH